MFDVYKEVPYEGSYVMESFDTLEEAKEYAQRKAAECDHYGCDIGIRVEYDVYG